MTANCINCGLNSEVVVPKLLKIILFKKSGKYYTEEDFLFVSDHYFQYSDEYEKSRPWKKWKSQGFHALIMGNEHPMGYPILIN